MASRSLLLIAAIFALASCGGGTDNVDASVGAPDAAERDSGATPDGGADRDAGALPDGGGGPRVYVHLRATHDPVAHAMDTAGQTPRDWTSGIRSLHLLRSMDDPAPALVFSHGDGFVEASYADGADTIVGSAPIASLSPGVFTMARTVHTHVRFTIDATVHTTLGAFPGEFEEVISLSDRTTIDGVVRMQGFYRYVFRFAGMEAPYEGSGLTLPDIAGGGFTIRIESGETTYYYAAPLEVTDRLTGDDHMIFEVNVHEGFRWVDQPMAGYGTGVFDTTAVTTEPIVQAGANGYRYFTE